MASGKQIKKRVKKTTVKEKKGKPVKIYKQNNTEVDSFATLSYVVMTEKSIQLIEKQNN